jgi:LysR family glycine cleavage system transcriptional activator
MTRPARELLPALTGAFDAIDAALRRLGRDAVAAPPLRLAAPAGFAAGWLLPRLVRFHRREPAIALMLTATERLIAPAEDAGGDGFDACIRHGRAGWSGDLGCDFLFADRLIPVCSPAYLATQALAAESEDPLAGHVLLEALSAAEAWRDWSAWSGWPAQGARRLAFGDERLVLDAALGGLGIALCDRALVGERLAEGRLVAPLEPHELVRGTAWFLVYARSSRRLDAIAACRDWLLEESDGPLL